MINVIDYGAGNIHSVARAFRFHNHEVVVTDDISTATTQDILVLPGVGAFGQAMTKLRQKGLEKQLKEKVLDQKIPFLGICLGLQLLFETSEESPDIKGLGFFKGSVKRFENKPNLSVPQIGWNTVTSENSFFEKSLRNQFFYFVHSFYVAPTDKNLTLCETEYGQTYVSAIQKDNIIATQFHPEKSGQAGLFLLDQMLTWFKKYQTQAS